MVFGYAACIQTTRRAGILKPTSLAQVAQPKDASAFNRYLIAGSVLLVLSAGLASYGLLSNDVRAR